MAQKPIKVLIVDDAVVIRSVLRTGLSAVPGIEVVDVAANGKIALAKLEIHEVDLVVMDLEMPVMGGVETLREIRKDRPKLPVVIFSGVHERAAAPSLDAMAQGATSCLAKPVSFDRTARGSGDVIKDELVPLIKSLCQTFDHCAPPKVAAALPSADAAAKRAKKPDLPIDVLVIGSSTGGPNAVSEVLRALPADFPVPILITQHMPATFTSHFANRLNEECAIGVYEGANDMPVEVGCAYIAPGDYHMEVTRGLQGRLYLRTNQDPMENSVRPAVDPMMRSVIRVFGGSALTVILTGMGSDGLAGCQAMSEAGGRIIAQDEETSVVWGMPGYVAREGLADGILPLAEIGPTIKRWCMKKKTVPGGNRE